MNELERLIKEGYIRIELRNEKEFSLYGKGPERIILAGERKFAEYKFKDLDEKESNEKDIRK